MILLDTNVLSEPLNARPHPDAIDWLDRQISDTLWISVITVAEMRAGIALLPPGVRRDRLRSRFEELALPAFRERVLPVDERVAARYGEVRGRLKAAGVAITPLDGLLAATALEHRLIVASRDTAPFLAAGLQVIDPFAAEAH